ncbi:MAG: prepilin-type N-terminal cleavage/methylation domain-containing protein, partial [Candidatus Paceibacterota bacterium]
MPISIKYKKNGFTLIELLVVISIIALFSSVVLAAVKDARNKGNVAKVKADMIQIRNAAELYKNDKGSYPLYFSDLIPT